MKTVGFQLFWNAEVESGSLGRLLAELLSYWMAAGSLVDELAGGGWCWLAGWLATGTTGALVSGCPKPDIYQETQQP